MELRKRLDSRIVFVVIYFSAFLAYIIYGLQPAGAIDYAISSTLSIPKIGLYSDVTTLELEGRELKTPDSIVGSFSNQPNKTLLIGHSTTVFQRLNELDLFDSIKYGDSDYQVVKISLMPKSKIIMRDLLKEADKDTLVLMTCTGTLLDNHDATHRLIITAVKNS